MNKYTSVAKIIVVKAIAHYLTFIAKYYVGDYVIPIMRIILAINFNLNNLK